FGFVFFFSSRRRHTRFDCDWSSDVCSSDLGPRAGGSGKGGGAPLGAAAGRPGSRAQPSCYVGAAFPTRGRFVKLPSREARPTGRSEERRVGKEGGWRGGGGAWEGGRGGAEN